MKATHRAGWNRRFPVRSVVAGAAVVVLSFGCHDMRCSWRACCPDARGAEPSCCAASGSCCETRKRVEEMRIRAVLDRQREDWNRGDIEGYMQGYVRSDQLSFASGGTITRGWDETLARYRQRYPDKAAMGTLSFDDIEVRVACGPYALVTGRWKLTRDAGPVEGVFTVIFEKRDGPWVIIHDHSSVSP